MSEVSLIDGHIDDKEEYKECKDCLNGRWVVSENGYHCICCLKLKKAMDCIKNNKSSYIKKPIT